MGSKLEGGGGPNFFWVGQSKKLLLVGSKKFFLGGGSAGRAKNAKNHQNRTYQNVCHCMLKLAICPLTRCYFDLPKWVFCNGADTQTHRRTLRLNRPIDQFNKNCIFCCIIVCLDLWHWRQKLNIGKQITIKLNLPWPNLWTNHFCSTVVATVNYFFLFQQVLAVLKRWLIYSLFWPL